MIEIVNIFVGNERKGWDKVGKKHQFKIAPLIIAPRHSILPGNKMGICFSSVLERGVKNLGEIIQVINRRIE